MNEVPHFSPEDLSRLDFTSCRLNTPDEVILAQVNGNIRRGLPQARPYHPNPQIVLLVAGGPSLAETERELVDAYWAGGKVVTVNGAYDWCIERNIRPSMQVMIDAREFNVRFVEREVEGCQYLLASQVHPKAFDICRHRNVVLWHLCSTGDDEYEMLKRFYFDRVSPVPIGTTVTIRAISLLRMLGFTRMEIFGLDSCVSDNHHAYPQSENDGEPAHSVWLRIKDRDDLSQRFLCTVWHAKQADDFMDLVREHGDSIQLKVHGPGLISTMLRLGARMEVAPTIGE